MATSTYDEARAPRQTEARPPRRRRVVLWFVIVAVLLGLVGGGHLRLRPVPAEGDRQLLRRARCRRPRPVAASPPRSARCRAISTASAPWPRCARSTSRPRSQAGSKRSRSSAGAYGPAPAHPWCSSTTRRSRPISPPFRRSEKLATANLERRSSSPRRNFATQATVDQNQQALEAGARRHRPQPGDHRPEAGQGALRRRARPAPGRARPVCRARATRWSP